jgi:hypothetical protein
MRILDNQKDLKQNQTGQALGPTNQIISEFKDETSEFANDGTQLVERNGIADVYYAMVLLLKYANMPANNEPESRGKWPGSNSPHPSQIVEALRSLFSLSYGRPDVPNSNFYEFQRFLGRFNTTESKVNDYLMPKTDENAYKLSELEKKVIDNFSNSAMESSNYSLLKSIENLSKHAADDSLHNVIQRTSGHVDNMRSPGMYIFDNLEGSPLSASYGSIMLDVRAKTYQMSTTPWVYSTTIQRLYTSSGIAVRFGFSGYNLQFPNMINQFRWDDWIISATKAEITKLQSRNFEPISFGRFVVTKSGTSARTIVLTEELPLNNRFRVIGSYITPCKKPIEDAWYAGDVNRCHFEFENIGQTEKIEQGLWTLSIAPEGTSLIAPVFNTSQKEGIFEISEAARTVDFQMYNIT